MSLFFSHKGSSETLRLTCNFIISCSGYYNYEEGFTPIFPGRDQYQGKFVHPQKWTEDIDYAGKKVVVIGSGATAVTLVPEMAKTAAHVTMLQRSPSYLITMPGTDTIANLLRNFLSPGVVSWITKWKNVLTSTLLYQLSRRSPEFVKTLLRWGIQKELGPDFDVNTHFNPRYNPWEQRLCLVLDSDLFKAIRDGTANIVTGEIETLTEKGLLLKSGENLEADLIVSATGLNLRVLGGIDFFVDETQVDLSKRYSYKGCMISGLPNFALVIGYTNASWTLKSDLSSEFICRLLNEMDRKGSRVCCAEVDDSDIGEVPLMDFSSSYVVRDIHKFPKQGTKAPWRLYQNYLLDLISFRYGSLEDGAMHFHTDKKDK
eukprot:TRINITY_DN939_c0_g1_i1.p1 TRINITY_DN939_c0_g1~~TRINITY_DN939_c0_g1_i1.p1  ORF type:complete len:374 (+),score=47.27 TRINITY_DN939_c0_g1_i1:422-1543(+)